jgi:catechol 2,3-dioxygenase-like lactoylglutathione lyase family enzyme
MKFEFDAVFYYVSDLKRAIKFYTDVLGFKLQSRDYVARFLIGDILFELVPTTDNRKLQGGGNARLCLKVDDIRSAILDLSSKGVPTANPESKENGILACFYDPDDNEICLWQYAA